MEGDDSVAGMLLNYQDKKGAHMVVDPALTTVDQSFDNQKVTDILKNHMDNWPKSITTMWMVGYGYNKFVFLAFLYLTPVICPN